MQHFGCPTRLLDWTGSPYVAAYFAVADGADCDGAVWIFDTAPLLEGPPSTKPGVKLAQRQFFSSMTRRDFFWERKIANLIMPISMATHHLRLSAQQGAFTVASSPGNHGDIIDNSFANSNHGHCHKFVIPTAQKTEILSKLIKMNVSASSLFPGLDGLGRAARDLLRLSAESFVPI